MLLRQAINSWYEDRGILGQVVDAELSEGGICEMKARESRESRERAGVRAL